MSVTIAQPRFAAVDLATGVRLRYAEYGDAGMEPIICLHGYTDSSFSYSRVAPILAELGYRIYALDQRGHGDSERPASGYAMQHFAADAVAFMDAFGIARAQIIGHSMGGLIGRRVAALSPDRVARLVLISSFGSKGTEAARELLEPVRVLPDPVPEAFVREFQASTIHTPVPEPFFERVIAESMKPPAHVWLAALEGHFTANEGVDLGRIAAPTLLLWGEQDGLIPREDQEQLLAAIPGSRLIAYPETGHDPHWERPERVVAHLDAFLREA